MHHLVSSGHKLGATGRRSRAFHGLCDSDTAEEKITSPSRQEREYKRERDRYRVEREREEREERERRERQREKN